MTREALGRLVRDVWIAWAKEQPNPKPSWLVEWDGLSEPDREVDRRIGEVIAAAERARILTVLRAVPVEELARAALRLHSRDAAADEDCVRLQCREAEAVRLILIAAVEADT